MRLADRKFDALVYDDFMALHVNRNEITGAKFVIFSNNISTPLDINQFEHKSIFNPTTSAQITQRSAQLNNLIRNLKSQMCSKMALTTSASKRNIGIDPDHICRDAHPLEIINTNPALNYSLSKSI